MPLNFRFTSPYISPASSSISQPAPLPRKKFFARRRSAHLTLGLLCFVLCTSLLHPSINTGAQTNLDRVKSWSIDHGNTWLTSLQDWGPTLKGDEKACIGWNPAASEEEDPVGCLKARQYRQTRRVLAREEDAQHGHWFFTRDHNIATLRNITYCFLPTSDPSHTACPRKPLVVSGWWYTAETLDGATTGEVIWQNSIVKQLKMLGYSYIAVGPYANWVEVAEMMPDVYVTLWSGELDVVSCIMDPRCVAREHYTPPENETDLSVGVPDEERGVLPLWNINVVDYWGTRPRDVSHGRYWWGLETNDEWSYNPLGQQWVATPWPLPGHFHLPYSIEEQCLHLPVKPHDKRRDAALIFAKRSSYFGMNHISPASFWTNLSSDPTFDLLLTADIEEGHSLPDGLESLGRQSIADYEELVGSVKALIGMGAPPISPSVYTALCQATPVVIPYFEQNFRLDGWNLYSGAAQHGPAIAIGEPYVYKYFAQNYTQLVNAVHRAMETPIERFIPEDMKLSFTISQLKQYLSRDLEAMGRASIASSGGTVLPLPAGVRKRCYELGRCRPLLPEGRIPYPRRQNKEALGDNEGGSSDGP